MPPSLTRFPHQGDKGFSGLTGASGSKGVPGDAGAIGPPGPPGAIGQMVSSSVHYCNVNESEDVTCLGYQKISA